MSLHLSKCHIVGNHMSRFMIVTADQEVQLVGSPNDNLIYPLAIILIALLHDDLINVAYLTACVFIRSS